ncbi:hypothetical protein [Pseudonocardia sp.]|uniref:hypothetical protein n=1 Tax=Pseudonocardia sp. TaxID=60912 RepID=UPI0026134EFD|nr:hypothetical protein [Pseudonocardia sp.]MCW2720706.1 hypothetical protein [Pseudonocardia sp.]
MTQTLSERPRLCRVCVGALADDEFTCHRDCATGLVLLRILEPGNFVHTYNPPPETEEQREKRLTGVTIAAAGGPRTAAELLRLAPLEVSAAHQPAAVPQVQPEARRRTPVSPARPALHATSSARLHRRTGRRAKA